MAHCFLGHAGAWAKLTGALSDPPDALAFDLPGHGARALPEDPGDFHAQVTAEVPGYLAALGPAPLGFGHSFGGAVLLRHAAHHPRDFAGLILIEPVFFAAAHGTPAYDAWVQSEAPVYDLLVQGRAEDAVRVFLAPNGDGTPWEAIPPPDRARLVAQIPLVAATRAGLVDDSGGLLDPGRLQGLDLPVLLMTGAQSPPIFGAVCQGLAARLPCAETAVIDGAGHMLPITHARPVAAVIDAWRARHGV